jgi:hypothetical protein
MNIQQLEQIFSFRFKGNPYFTPTNESGLLSDVRFTGGLLDPSLDITRETVRLTSIYDINRFPPSSLKKGRIIAFPEP